MSFLDFSVFFDYIHNFKKKTKMNSNWSKYEKTKFKGYHSIINIQRLGGWCSFSWKILNDTKALLAWQFLRIISHEFKINIVLLCK